MDNNNPFSGINVKLVKALGKKRVLRTIRRRLNIEWRDIKRRKLEVQAMTARARNRQLVRVLKLKQQCNAINTSRRIVQDSLWSTTYEEPTSQAIATPQTIGAPTARTSGLFVVVPRSNVSAGSRWPVAPD